MNVVYDPAFLEKLRKADVKIRKSFKEKIILFSQNLQHPQLNNHSLKREFKGYRSINITADLRAIYKEIEEGEEMIAYFVLIGTHKELYR